MRKVSVAGVTAAALAVLAVACAEQNPTAPSGSAVLGGPAQTAVTAHCPGHQTGNKIESGPFTFTPPAGEVVSGVCIKAGTSIFMLGLNDTDGCYTTVTTGGVTTVAGGGTCARLQGHLVCAVRDGARATAATATSSTAATATSPTAAATATAATMRACGAG